MAAGVEPGDRVAIWAPNASSSSSPRSASSAPARGWCRQHPLQRRRSRVRAEEERRPLLFTVTTSSASTTSSCCATPTPSSPPCADVIVCRRPARRARETSPSSWPRGDAVDEDDRRHAIDAIDGDDVADIMFTSGTTGRPKGVLLTHAQSLRAFEAVGRALRHREGDRDLIVPAVLPLLRLQGGVDALPHDRRDRAAGGHLRTGRGAAHHRAGAGERDQRATDTLVVDPRPSRHGAHRPLVAAHRASSAPLRTRPSSSAACSPSSPFEHLSTGYGLTEATAMCSITRPGDSPDTIATWNCGTPVDDIEIRIVDDDGDDVEVGTPGELLIRGLQRDARLLRRSGRDAPRRSSPTAGCTPATSRSPTTTATSGSSTGRRTSTSPAGSTCHRRRWKATCSRDDRLAEVAVVGIPDERMGEVGVAFVVPRPECRSRPKR